MAEIYSTPHYFNVISIQFFIESEIKRPKLIDDWSFSNSDQKKQKYYIKFKNKYKLNKRNRSNDWVTSKIYFRETFNQKLKLGLKQKKRRDHSIRYFK